MSTQPRPRVTDAEARALASGVRWRILALCAHEELTNRELAGALELNPGTTLHHVRTLTATGFLETRPARQGRRGAKEIPYATTDKLSRVDAGDVTDPVLDAFTHEFTAAPYDDRTLARGTLRLTHEEMEEFVDRLGDLMREYDARPDGPDSATWGVFIATYPGYD